MLRRVYAVASLSAAMAVFSAAAGAQVAPPSGQFTITQDGKTLGDAQYSASPVSGGQALVSSGHMSLKKFSYSFHSQMTVDGQGNLVHDQLSGSVKGEKQSGDVQFTTASDPTGKSFNIQINAAGKQTTNTVDRHRNLVLMADFDPAAYSLMAHFALTQPQTAWVLIPKQNGLLVPAEYNTVADVHGTLDGQNITVKHATVVLSAQNSLVVELFYTSTGNLLEADLNSQNFYVIRNGFKLIDRPKPVAPPPGQVPQGQDGQQQGPEQGAPDQQAPPDQQGPPPQQ